MTTSPEGECMKECQNTTILNPDILWIIFNLTAEDEGIGPVYRLIDIMSCSHACSQWRRILLDSPIIWGKLVILYDWSMPKEWIEEILVRSKSAPLWIHATVYGAKTYSEKSNEFFNYFMEILDRVWSRVERFTWVMGFGTEAINENMWRIFQRPSPVLQAFSMHHSHTSIDFDSDMEYSFAPDTPEKPLFGDNAPRLQHFTTNVIANLPHGDAWFRSLRSLSIIGPLCNMELRSLMTMLVHIPRLEELAAHNTLRQPLSWFDLSNESHIYPALSFPSLNSLSIDMSIRDAVHFLNNITISKKGCGIQILCEIPTHHSSIDELVSILKDNLGPHFRSLLMDHIVCHNLYIMKAIKLKISIYGDFTFTCCDFGLGTPCFGFLISVTWDGYPSTELTKAVLSFLYNTFNHPINKGVQSLDISYTVTPWEYPRFISHNLPFFQAFPYITHLTIDDFLPSFWKMFKDQCFIAEREQQDPTVWKRDFPFPRLHTILTTKAFSIGNTVNTSPFRELCDFLRHCDIIGIDPPAVQIEIFPADIRLLARFTKNFPDVELVYWNAEEGKCIKCLSDIDD